MANKAPNNHEPAVTPQSGAQTDEVETDAGPSRGGKSSRGSSERRCIATHKNGSPADMIRFALSPDGQVTPDIGARLPGRGAWVCANRAAIDAAVEKHSFSRAFRAQVTVASDLADQVEKLLSKAVLDKFGLGRRAGDIISGFDQVREAVRAVEPACLVEASDGAEDGRGKIMAIMRARRFEEAELALETDYRAGHEDGSFPACNPPVLVGCFTSEELGMALGRERVIHACVKHGRFAQAWTAELARLSGFRPLWPDGWLNLATPRVSERANARDAGYRPLNAPHSDGDVSEGET